MKDARFHFSKFPHHISSQTERENSKRDLQNYIDDRIEVLQKSNAADSTRFKRDMALEILLGEIRAMLQHNPSSSIKKELLRLAANPMPDEPPLPVSFLSLFPVFRFSLFLT